MSTGTGGNVSSARSIRRLSDMVLGATYSLTCDMGEFTLEVVTITDGVVECRFTTNTQRADLHRIFDGHSTTAWLYGWMPTQRGFLNMSLRPAGIDADFGPEYLLQAKAYVAGKLQGEDLGPNCRFQLMDFEQPAAS
jgi:hypothetical protein